MSICTISLDLLRSRVAQVNKVAWPDEVPVRIATEKVTDARLESDCYMFFLPTEEQEKMFELEQFYKSATFENAGDHLVLSSIVLSPFKTD